MVNPVCPQCGRELERVVQKEPKLVNDAHFETMKSGDWYCTVCPSNGRSVRDVWCYWWSHEVKKESDSTLLSCII
jgi:hypothetical protein